MDANCGTFVVTNCVNSVPSGAGAFVGCWVCMCRHM